ncbi:hypothetical protein V8B97DRAFT_1843586, partial [Scleroderma yunnanense]
MVNNQPKNRLSKLKLWKTKSIEVTANPQFALSPPALAPNIPSTSCRLTNITTGKLVSLKKLLCFHR